jgi:hypothetical protein
MEAITHGKTGRERRRDLNGLNPRTSPSHPLQTGRFPLSSKDYPPTLGLFSPQEYSYRPHTLSQRNPLPASDPHHTTRTSASAGNHYTPPTYHDSLPAIHRRKATTLPFPSEPSLAIPYLWHQTRQSGAGRLHRDHTGLRTTPTQRTATGGPRVERKVQGGPVAIRPS